MTHPFYTILAPLLRSTFLLGAALLWTQTVQAAETGAGQENVAVSQAGTEHPADTTAVAAETAETNIEADSEPGLLPEAHTNLVSTTTPDGAPRRQVLDRIVAVVGDTAITASRLEREYDALAAAPEGASRSREEVLSRMIEIELLQQRAADRGLTAGTAEVDAAIRQIMRDNHLPSLSALERALKREGRTLASLREELETELTAMQVVRLEVMDRVRVGETDAVAFYKAHPERFSPPPQVRVRQIVLSFSGLSEAGKGAAVIALHQARRQMTGPASFAKAERRLADTPGITVSSAGPLSRDELREELAETLFSLPEGGISEPVALPTGMGLFLVEKVIPSRPLPYAQVAEQARSLALEEKREARFAEWFAKLKRDAHVEIRLESPAHSN